MWHRKICRVSVVELVAELAVAAVILVGFGPDCFGQPKGRASSVKVIQLAEPKLDFMFCPSTHNARITEKLSYPTFPR